MKDQLQRKLRDITKEKKALEKMQERELPEVEGAIKELERKILEVQQQLSDLREEKLRQFREKLRLLARIEDQKSHISELNREYIEMKDISG